MPSKTENFIERMSGVFGPPNGELGRVMAAHLMSFDEQILTATAEQFILTRKWKTWPMPVEIIAACKNEVVKASPPPSRKREDYPWDEFRCKRADHLIEGDLGVQAAEGGWLGELWDFCRVNERKPDQHEVKRICDAAERHMVSNQRSLETVLDDAKWSKKTASVRASLLGLVEKRQQVSEERRERVLAWAKQRAA